MIAGIPLSRCGQCGAGYFPARLICHRCGHAQWTEERAPDGVVEEVTVVTHAIGQENWIPRKIASVRLSEGQLIVAGIADDVHAGMRVCLFEDNGSPHGRAASA